MGINAVLPVLQTTMNLPALKMVKEVGGVIPPNANSVYSLRSAQGIPAVGAVRPIVPHGLAMTREFVGQALATDPFLHQLLVQNCNAGILRSPFTTPTVSRVVQLLCKIRYIASNKYTGSLSEKNTRVHILAMAELLAHGTDQTSCLDTAKARTEIIRLVVAAFDDPATYGLPELADWYHESLYGMATRFAAGTVWDITDALVILEGWSVHMVNPSDLISSTSLISTLIVSLCKKGTVSERALEKITEGIRNDIGEPVIINPYTVMRTYAAFGNKINTQNAQAYFTHLESVLPGHATRLTATITQAAGTGLTTYLTIRRALQDIPHFPWAVAVKYFPSEFTKFLHAAEVINNNMYYGFNKDLGAAVASNFPNLAYLWFEIGKKVINDRNLNEYKGAPRVVPKKNVIDRLITAFLAQDARLADAKFSDMISVTTVERIYKAGFDEVEAAVLIDAFRDRVRIGVNIDLVVPVAQVPEPGMALINTAGASSSAGPSGAMQPPLIPTGAAFFPNL